jgi:hypothetical protein
MKFIKKIYKTITFIFVLIASFITSVLVTSLAAKTFFGIILFEKHINECPNPPPPGCGFGGYNPISLTTYPYSILSFVFVFLIVITIFLYSFLIVKYLIKDK